MADQKIPSFVPKQDEAKNVQSHVAHLRRGLNMFFFFSLVVFFLSIAGVVLSYLYEQYNGSLLEAKKEELSTAKSQYDPETVTILNRFDTRLRVVKGLVENHQAFSPIFEELANFTLEAVQFKSFEAIILENGNVMVVGNGEALSYEALAVQSDTFAKSEYILNPIFSDFDRQDNSRVVFSYSLEFDKAIITYSPE